ncbi:MAG: hypothetical protein D3909_18535, partial [Candidatus Electrothrix sp. ATG1]|nr:hypothetical protein [Candidatus Electrothrix sp. ATG1]
MRVQKRNIQKPTTLAVLLALPLLLSSLPLSAETAIEPDNLEAVLEGFEEEATGQAPANELDSVLDGFDDEV